MNVSDHAYQCVTIKRGANLLNISIPDAFGILDQLNVRFHIHRKQYLQVRCLVMDKDSYSMDMFCRIRDISTLVT